MSAGGRLFVVGTPIGNLGDVSARAVETLAAVALIAAEDTRVARRLLQRQGIATHAVSYHARNAGTRGPELLERLRSGDDVALVTDAGTPGVSDPGDELVAAWAAEGGTVVSVPGPSAVTAAVAVTGIAGPRWVFEGFLPRSGRERRERITRLADDERGAVLFEAPGRLAATLRDLASACGPDRPAAVCRELTKIHEEVIRGTLGDLAARAGAGSIDRRGEAVIVLGWRGRSDRAVRGGSSASAEEPDAADAAEDGVAAALAEVERLVDEGVARGEAARRVSAERGILRRRLYRVARD